jgi:hypothetical protein
MSLLLAFAPQIFANGNVALRLFQVVGGIATNS